MANSRIAKGTTYRHATLEFGQDLWADLAKAALAADLSRSQYVRKAVRELLAREAEATPKSRGKKQH